MYVVACARCTFLYVQLTCCMNRTAACWWSRGKTLHFRCLRAAPLLRGLVVKSGHKRVFPPSLHLPLHSPLSCLVAPSFFYLSVPAHIPTLSPATDSFSFLPSSVFMQPSAKPKHLPASLSSLIAFHPSPSFSLYLSLPCSPLSVSLSMLISVIRL